MSRSLLTLATDLCADYGRDLEQTESGEWRTTEPLTPVPAELLARDLRALGIETARIGDRHEPMGAYGQGKGFRVVFSLPTTPEAAQ